MGVPRGPVKPNKMVSGVAYVLRHEQATHKVQYSKVGKGDVSAAVLGVIIATFVGYLALSSVGSGAINLTDLTLALWYLGLILVGLREVRAALRPHPPAMGGIAHTFDATTTKDVAAPAVSELDLRPNLTTADKSPLSLLVSQIPD